MNLQNAGKNCVHLVHKIVSPLARNPIWNRSAVLDEMWAPYKKESIESLGTALQAQTTILDCRRVFTGEQLGYRVGWQSSFDCLTDIEDRLKGPPLRVLGHTNRISRLRDDRIAIGYVEKRHDASDYVYECIETLNAGIVTLRHHGNIVAAYPFQTHRVESGRGITFC